MIRKSYIPPVYEKKQISVDKANRYGDDKIGWAQQILLNKDKEEK